MMIERKGHKALSLTLGKHLQEIKSYSNKSHVPKSLIRRPAFTNAYKGRERSLVKTETEIEPLSHLQSKILPRVFYIQTLVNVISFMNNNMIRKVARGINHWPVQSPATSYHVGIVGSGACSDYIDASTMTPKNARKWSLSSDDGVYRTRGTAGDSESVVELATRMREQNNKCIAGTT